MSFPANLSKHRHALLEILGQAFRDPTRRTALKTRGVSMEPLVREADEVTVRAMPGQAIEVGDIVAYRNGEILLVHRIVAAAERDGERLFYEKGDNNMYMAAVSASRVMGVVTEVAAGGRRLDLRAPRFRRLGVWIAAYGMRAVKLYGYARLLGSRVVRPRSAVSRAARRLVRALLQLPIRVPLALARRVF